MDIPNLPIQPIKCSRKKYEELEREMILKQLPDVPLSKKLRFNDIARIVRHTNISIFDNDNCSLWTGYVTNRKHKNKGTYINFYFKGRKKVALHRLLYANFKGKLDKNDYIKFSCQHKGECCNVNHMVKFEYSVNNTNDNSEKNEQPNIKKTKKPKISHDDFFEKSNFNFCLFI